MTDDNKG